MAIPSTHIFIHCINFSRFARLAISLGNVLDYGFKSTVVELVPQSSALGEWPRVPKDLGPKRLVLLDAFLDGHATTEKHYAYKSVS